MTRDLYIKFQNIFANSNQVRFLVVLFAEYSIFVFCFLGLSLLWHPAGVFVLIGATLSMVLARLVLAQAIYFLLPSPRPYQLYGLKPPFSKLFSWKHKQLDSFPSGHTSAMVGFAAFIAWFFPFLGLLGLGFALLTAGARVATGFHFLLDIFAGWVVGLVAAGLVLLGSVIFFT